MSIIVRIHDLKEPGEFADPDDTVNMIRDLFDEWKEYHDNTIIMEKKMRELERFKEAAESSIAQIPIVVESEELRLTIDRSEQAERDVKRLSKIGERRGNILHPVFGACDDTDMRVCSVCKATKDIADSTEKYAQELLDLRKILRRSEIVMRRAIWNKKMQDPKEIASNEVEAKLVTEAIATSSDKPLTK